MKTKGWWLYLHNHSVRQTVRRTVHNLVDSPLSTGQSTDDELSTPPCNDLSKCPGHLSVFKLQPEGGPFKGVAEVARPS